MTSVQPSLKRAKLGPTPEALALPSSGSQAHCLPSAASSQQGEAWCVRSLFWQPQGPTGLPAADLDEELGPLTQMATAGGGSLAQAFCPSCGCFLSDVSDTEAERQGHVDSCQASDGPPGGPATGGADEGAEDECEGASDGNSEAGEAAAEEQVLDQEEEEDALAAAAEKEAAADWEVECIAIMGSSKENSDGCDSSGEAALRTWLGARGLQKYADHFIRAGANLALLPFLSGQDLKQMGIAALGARKKVLLGAAELAAGGGPASAAAAPTGWEGDGEGDACLGEGPPGGEAQAGPQGGQQQKPVGGVGDWRALSGAGEATLFCANIRRYFKPDPSKPPPGPDPQPTTEGILQYFQPKNGSSIRPWKPPAPAAAAATAGPAAAFAGGAGCSGAAGKGRGRGKQSQWAHKAAAGDAPGGGGKRFGGGRFGRGATAQPVPLKPWHLVPGTAFVVDRFNQLPPGLPNQNWFLTHFHADHYKGLSSKFDLGMLHCSLPTARLVQQQLRVAQQRIVPHPLNAPFVVEGVRITFLDANHCPGAVMVLFELPGQRPVLHTGDCRLVPAMQQEPALQAVRGKCDLILDTTYCSPEYSFPTQAEVLQFSIDAVKAEAFNPKTLFLFGSYTIGKERLFLEAARVLHRKVYVSATKRKVLDCLDLPPEYSSLLTCNDAETNLHAVPLWMVTHKHMTKILKFYRGRFTNVVGFQPTGWTHQRDVNKTRARGRRQQKGTVITYQVPYSEHSSFTELRDFVAWLAPVRIIPHVNTDNGGPKATRMVRLLRGQDAS